MIKIDHGSRDDTMEKRLRKLFEYQKFANDPQLERLIGETEARCGVPLSEEQLGAVNAAGTGTLPYTIKDPTDPS